VNAALPRIRFLQDPTSDAWVEQALANLDTILLDHSHCERKAASVAVNLMCRYPAATQLVAQLTLIAQEELTHYAQVNQILADRGIPLAPLQPPPYGAALNQQIRRQEPDRRLDCLLVAGLIEARSHERLGLLAAHLPDRELAAFYRSLMASEARHYGVYWVLADAMVGDLRSVGDHRAVLTQRLEELAAVESEILATLHPQPRIHS
jgi:tRNA 2-(methylsulfanyl)-N6-isopentenyladenosine37 hydroxylase